ncbi:phage/plasmid primase, P4 family [Streptomyces tendae]|uniref:phage/plasmid primase, P4 family n=1 Tax=Streptomyces tendae TaxID=1932 RepID=UPI0036775BE6
MKYDKITPPAGPDLSDFFRWLWDGAEGWVAVVAKYPEDDDFPHSWYRWPVNADLLTEDDDATDGMDVWFAPSLFAKRSRKVVHAIPGRIIWADLDHTDDWDTDQWERVNALLGELHAVTVRSGSGDNLHVYVKLAEPLANGEDTKAWNQRLAAALGGDRQAVDAARVLRFPGTVNQKTGAGPVVLQAGPDGFEGWTPEALGELLPAPQAAKAKTGTDGSVVAGRQTEISAPTSRGDGYARTALQGECTKIRALADKPDGEGEGTLNAAGFNVGQVVGADWNTLTHAEALAELLAAHDTWPRPYTKDGGAKAKLDRALQDGAKQPRELPWANPTAGHRGQLRMAERFVSEHGDSLRHVHSIGWHRWDGARWAEDKRQTEMRAAVETVKTALHEAVDLNGSDREDLLKDARKSESAGGLEGMVRIAGVLDPISVAPLDVDAHPHLFNTPQGTIDLTTGEIRDNDRRDLLTKAAGAPLTGDTCAEWDKFLCRVLPDADVRAFLQRVFGYAMLGEVREEVLLILTGTGANGKTTLADALAEAFGDYAIEIDPAMLMESKHERHGAFKMRLKGARLAFSSETEKGRRFAEATVKRLTDKTPIEANLMHKNPIQFAPSHLLVMLTNHLPQISGDDPAIWRRVKVVPFDVVIPEGERDPGLAGRLRAAAPAVLAWAYQGWLEYQRIGLAPPEAVKARTDAYRDSSDALGRFLADMTERAERGRTKARELFTAWALWARQNGEEPGTEIGFAESMKARGFEKKKSAGTMTYPGMILRDSEPLTLH